MEAVAEHDFLAGSNDELSFKRGDVLKVLNKDEDPHWYKAELDGNEGFIPSNYIRMTDCNWYLGEITRKDAEVLLKKPNIRDGHFLVRQCENSPGEFSISVRFRESVHHFKVARDQNGKYYLCSIKFNSLNELVTYHRAVSLWRTHMVLLVNMSVETRSDGSSCHNTMPSRVTSKSFGYTPAAVEIVALCNNANPSSPTDPEEIEELEYRREMDQFLEKEMIRLRVAINKIRRAEMIECGFPAPQLTGESDEDFLNIDFNNNNGN